MSKRAKALDIPSAAEVAAHVAAMNSSERRKREPVPLVDLLDSQEHAAFMLKRAHSRMRRAATIAKKWNAKLRRLQKRIAIRKALDVKK